MSSHLTAVTVLICGILLYASAVATADNGNEPVFALGFDGTTVARGPDEEPIAPIKAQNVEFRPGLIGQALQADGALVEFAAELLPQEQGTLVMWLSPLADPPGRELSYWRIYFGDADDWGPLGMPRLWLFNTLLRFDMDDGKWLWSAIPVGAGWSGGAWHQLVGIWDCAGYIALYFDGKLLMERQVRSWQPQKRRAFCVGTGVGYGHQPLPAHALIDEVALYDYAMSAQEVKQMYYQTGVTSLRFKLSETVFELPPDQLPVVATNVGAARWQSTVQWSCEERRGSFALDLPPGAEEQLTIKHPLSPSMRGEASIQIDWHEGIDYRQARSEQLRPYILPSLEPPAEQPPEWQMVGMVDCTEQAPISEAGNSQVVEGPAGRYREAGRNRWDRFAYIFELSAPRRLARLTVEYPDDATRAIVVASNIPIEDEPVAAGAERHVLANGLLTGGKYDLTNQMQRRQYFFPAMSQHVAVIIETGMQDEPAAVRSLTLEEADLEYGPTAPPPALQAQTHRRMGLYWEDPIFGQDFGWTGTDYRRWDEVLNRALNYMAWSGQDLLVYPTVWYQGPIYRSEAEPGTWPSGGRAHPSGYPRLMAMRCAQRGIKFISTFTIWHLPSLAHLILPAEQVAAGKPSVNTVTREGEVLTSNNWHSPPLLNAQHPKVQEVLLRLVDEHITMCADQPSFAGIQFALWPSSPMQAGARLLTSYDDWTVNQFAHHIGESPPGGPQEAERFKQRADWILNDAQRRQQWIQWRCDQMTDFYGEVAARLAKANPQAKLRLVVQQPYPWVEMEPAKALRQQGIDIEALSHNSDIVITRFTNQTFDRIARLAHPAFVPPGGTELGVITDYDTLELTRQIQQPFYGLPRTNNTTKVISRWGEMLPS